MFATSNATAAAPAWTKTPVAPGIGFNDVACPAPELCVAAAFSGVTRSTAPGATSPVWSIPVQIDPDTTVVACATTALCVAAAGNRVRQSTDGGLTWGAPATVAPGAPVFSTVACASVSLCVAGDSTGHVALGVAPPENTAPLAISGTPEPGQTLTATAGTWTATPTTVTRAWQRCDAAGAACADITAETGLTYVVQAADQGATVRVQETAVNGGGTGTATASVLVPSPPGPSPSPEPSPSPSSPGPSSPTPAPVTGPTDAQIRAALRPALRVTGAAARHKALLKRGFSFTFKAPAAGRVAVTWESIPPKRARGRKAKPVVLARGERPGQVGADDEGRREADRRREEGAAQGQAREGPRARDVHDRRTPGRHSDRAGDAAAVAPEFSRGRSR